MNREELNRPATVREQILLGLVLLLLVGAFFRVLHAPQTLQIQERKKELAGLRMEREALDKFLETTPQVSQQEVMMRQKGLKARILQGEVPLDYREMESLLTQFTDPAFLGGVVIEKLSYQARVVEKEKGWSHTSVTLDLLGTFPDMVGYLERLEQFPALFSVENVNFEVRQDQPQELHVEVVGKLYRLEKPGGGA